MNLLVQTWNVLADMAPYLLLGFLAAGMLSVLVSPETIERHLGRGRFGPVVKAAALGIPLPLCSCGVIPVAAGLHRHGASRGATAAFLLSTPQTGVDSILVTYSLLGPFLAVYRPVIALTSGILGGSIAAWYDDDIKLGPGPAPHCSDACCSGPARESKTARALKFGFCTLPADIGPSLLLGLLAAGLISALVPESFFAGLPGGGLLPMLAMLCFGVPLYVCATASVPVAAALMSKGISPGAALVFLMTGPATNAAAIATLWKVLGKRTTLIYLGTVVVSALAAGMLLDYLALGHGMKALALSTGTAPGAIEHASAVILLLILAFSLRGHAHGD